jgi:hypothetical protein
MTAKEIDKRMKLTPNLALQSKLSGVTARDSCALLKHVFNDALPKIIESV